MKLDTPIFDADGRPIGSIEIPKEIIDAAQTVATWLKTQPQGTRLGGLLLVEQHDQGRMVRRRLVL